MSAAALYGLPLPLEPPDPIVDITAPVGLTQVRRPGVRSHRNANSETRYRRGLPVSAPAALFCELATLLGLDDLVAVGDALVLSARLPSGNRQRPLVRLTRLHEAVASASGSRGCRTARQAVALVREGVESPMETRLRLLVVRDGLPEPLPGVPVVARGRLLGYADLMWPTLRLILEYDGDQHRSDLTQYERDIRRLESFADGGYETIRIRSRGLLLEPDATAERIRARYLRRAAQYGESAQIDATALR